MQVKFSFQSLPPILNLIAHLFFGFSDMETQNATLSKVIDNYKKAYSEFIQIASHDLDTPLRKLSFLVEGLTGKYKNVQDDEIQNYVNRIETCLADMRSLVDSLERLFSI